MVRGFRETWVFVNKIRNVICMRKMCSVIWHLDGHSIFLFSAPRKSVSNVSATENMEQQEQKLMREGDWRIVIQLTSLAGAFPLPRFLPRNRLNKEQLRHEGREWGRIFLWSIWCRQRIVQQTLSNSPYISPAVNLCQREEGSGYFCGLEKGAGCWGSQRSQSRVLVPFVPDPLTSPHCWGLAFLGQFSLGHRVPHPKDMSPTRAANTRLPWAGRTSASPGWASSRALESLLGSNSGLLSPWWQNICEKLCPWRFSGEELPYSPWHQPLLHRGKNPSGTLGGVWYSAPGKHTSQVLLWNVHRLLGSSCCNFQNRQKQRFLRIFFPSHLSRAGVCFVSSPTKNLLVTNGPWVFT